MSEMEVYYGKYNKTDLNISDLDDDALYDLECKLGIQFINVDGVVYEFESIKDLDAYGFSLVIEPSMENRFIAMWYNGGAGIHDVVGEIIRKDLKNGET